MRFPKHHRCRQHVLRSPWTLQEAADLLNGDSAVINTDPIQPFWTKLAPTLFQPTNSASEALHTYVSSKQIKADVAHLFHGKDHRNWHDWVRLHWSSLRHEGLQQASTR
jgi:hypothetical protein